MAAGPKQTGFFIRFFKKNWSYEWKTQILTVNPPKLNTTICISEGFGNLSTRLVKK